LPLDSYAICIAVPPDILLLIGATLKDTTTYEGCQEMLNVVSWGAMHRAVGFQALHPVHEGDTHRQTRTYFDGSEIHTAAFRHMLQVLEPLRIAFVSQNGGGHSGWAEMEYLSAAGEAIAYVKSACMSRMRPMREGS